MITLKDCMRKIRPFNGEVDNRINKIWAIPDIEAKFEEELAEHPEWVALLTKHKPQYAVIEEKTIRALNYFLLPFSKMVMKKCQ